MELLKKELCQMLSDYEKCPNESIKQQILQDIILLGEALALLKEKGE